MQLLGMKRVKIAKVKHPKKGRKQALTTRPPESAQGNGRQVLKTDWKGVPVTPQLSKYEHKIIENETTNDKHEKSDERQPRN